MGMDLKQTGTGGVGLWDGASGGQNQIVQSLSVAVSRGATNTKLVGVLPANANIVGMWVLVPVLSDAATTANVSIGKSGGSNTFFTAAQDVKAATGTFAQAMGTAANWIAATTSTSVSVTYTETGTASTVGTFNVHILFVVI